MGGRREFAPPPGMYRVKHKWFDQNCDFFGDFVEAAFLRNLRFLAKKKLKSRKEAFLI